MEDWKWLRRAQLDRTLRGAAGHLSRVPKDESRFQRFECYLGRKTQGVASLALGWYERRLWRADQGRMQRVTIQSRCPLGG
jgi:hypothetical protein